MKAALVLVIGLACQYAQELPTAASISQWGQRVVDAVHLKQGDTIIDVGAGAEDIDKQSLDRARKTASERKLTNVEFVQGTSKGPALPDRCADLIVVMDAYHEFQFPAEMLAHISRALKDAGRLANVDFYKPDKLVSTLPPPWHIRLDKDDADPRDRV
jgi:ubiquinone/menaquinone biosynthesis C-methylase UbiE